MRLKHPTIQIHLERQTVPTPPIVPTLLSKVVPTPNIAIDITESSNRTPSNSALQPSKQSFMADYTHRPEPLKKCRQIDRQILKLIVKSFHPFSLVEQLEFKELLAMMNPGYKLPTRKTLSNSLLPKIYQECNEKNQININSAKAVSLTTDTWTSINNVSFMSITAHYLDSNGT